MSREDSHLTEEIDPALTDDRRLVSVNILSDGNVSHKYEVSVKDPNPYNFDPRPFMPNTDPMDLDKFFTIVSNVVRDAQEREGIQQDKFVQVTEEYPPEPFEGFGDEIIAYRVLKRTPGMMNTKATGRPWRKSRYAYDLQSEEHPNKVIVVESRPVDHIIEFSCWAKSNKLANARAIWLETLLISHTWAFEVQGIERFYWEGRGPDTYTTTGGQRLFYRPNNFFVRFRKFEVQAAPQIKRVEFDVTSK